MYGMCGVCVVSLQVLIGAYLYRGWQWGVQQTRRSLGTGIDNGI
jgi:hypothetical protein